MSFDPNNYDIFDDNVNTAQDYENVVSNTKGGTINQYLQKISVTNHDFHWVTLDKSSIGLDNVDNTSDLNKPISNSTQTALNSKLDDVIAGTNITIDKTDPNNPIINSTGSGTGVDWGNINGTLSNQTDLQSELDNKINIEAGKGLTTNDYDNIEKSNVGDNTIHRNSDGKQHSDVVLNNNHRASISNPHSVTKTQIGLDNVANVDTTTTVNITDSTNKRFVTDANLTILSNTSGVNTGDQDLSSYVQSSDQTVLNIIALTQAEYDAIPTKSSTTLYNITDAV